MFPLESAPKQTTQFPANVLVKANKECVLADMGMVYIIDTPEFAAMKSSATCRFMAPELMDPNAPRQTVEGPECTIQSDVFFAMTVVQIFSGDVPFSHKKNDTSIIPLILKGERPELPQYIQENPALAKLVRDYDEKMEWLIPMCWSQQPSKRPTMAYICWKLGLTSNFRYTLEWVNLV